MCEEGKALISGYLDALEEYDRRHLMLLAVFREGDQEGVDGFRGLVREAKSKVRIARGRFQEHQKRHNCCEIIHFEEDASGDAIIARHILSAKSQSSSAS
jgi:hypothetical protein